MTKKILTFPLIIALTGLLASCNSPSHANLPTATPTPASILPAAPGSTATVSTDAQTWMEKTCTEENDSPKYEIQAVWPNLVGQPAQIDPFNERVDAWVDSTKSDFLLALSDGADVGQGQGEAPTSTLSIDYDLTAVRDRLFSVQLTVTSYIAVAAHPGTFSYSLNYDTQSGVFITLEDLFLPGSDHMGVILGYVDTALEGRGFDYQAGEAAEVMAERENWNLLSEGLRINFDEYEVAPYAAGPQFVLIPWADLGGVLDPDGPAGVFIS